MWRATAFLVGILALSVALRVTHLTAQSLWADEGNSVRVTERPLALVIEAARADIHPPGYYLLLWAWVRLFGQGEAAVRSLSVVVGVMAVGLVYLVGREWLGPRAAWLGAFCAAVSPFQVRYSQEVRMYILVALLGTAATYAFARWIAPRDRHPSPMWSGLYVLAAAAGLWTHYSFPIVLVALNIAWLVWWFWPDRAVGKASVSERLKHAGRRNAALWWVSMQAIVALLYLPWLPIAWSKTWGYGGISDNHSLSFIVAQALKLLSMGESVADDDATQWLAVGVVGLSVFGAWGGLVPWNASRRRETVARTLALILVVLTPILLTLGLTLGGRAAYRPKFFLVAGPAFCVLVGGGIALLERPQGQRRTISSRLWLLLGLGIVGIAAARSLRNYYSDPAFARADYRAIAERIWGLERPEDAILLNAPNQWEVFTYYYQGHAPVYPLCRSRPPHREQVVAELEAIASGHERLFAVYWATQESDPERIVESWLERNAFKASDAWYGDVRLVTYGVQQPLSALSEPAHEHLLDDVRIGNEIALRGYTVEPDEVERGDILRLTLFWEALRVPSGRYKVFLHLIDGEGRIVSQVDSEPGHGMNLTSSWLPERGVFADRYGVWVPKTLQPGEYSLRMGMYDVSGAPRLQVSIDGDPSGDMFTLTKLALH